MEINSFIGTLTLILAVWLFVIQLKLNEISCTLKNLTKNNSDSTSCETEQKQPPANNNIQFEEETSSPVIRPENQPIQKIKQENENTAGSDKFENLFLGNLFNKIGAIAIIIAIGIFVKLIYPLVIFTPVIKTGLGFIAGLVMLLIAARLHNGNLKNYAEVLMGTGTAALFITTYCAYGILHTLSMPVAVTIGTIILTGTYLVADKLKTTSMLSIGLIGGYLNSVFLNSNATADFVFGYLIFLNALSLVYTYRNSEKSLINIINLPLTLCFAFYYSTKTELSEFLPYMLWGIYLVYDLYSLGKNRINTTLGWINYGFLTYFTIKFFDGENTALGIVLGITTLVYTILAVINSKRSSVLFKQYAEAVAVNIWLAVYFLTTDMQSIFIWSGEALALSWIAAKNKLFNNFNNFAVGIFITVFIGIFMAKYDSNLCITANYTPVWNMRLPLFGVPLAALLLSGALSENNSEFKENLYKYLAILVGFVYFHFETATFVANHQNMNIDYLTSVIWILYAGITATAGILRDNEILKTSGIWLCLLAITRIFFYDIASLETVYKLLAFTVLGIILMIVSYFYIKREK